MKKFFVLLILVLTLFLSTGSVQSNQIIPDEDSSPQLTYHHTTLKDCIRLSNTCNSEIVHDKERCAKALAYCLVRMPGFWSLML